MNICAKKIRIEFDNSSEDYWETTSESGIVFNEAMRMIAKAWEEHDGALKEPLIKDDKGHTQRLTIPSSYLENSCRMYRIDDLLGVDKNE